MLTSAKIVYRLKQIGINIWSFDPGFFNFRQGLKTVLAISISLFLVRNASLTTIILAGLGSGLSMQCVVARNITTRIIYVLLFDLACFFSFSLGLFVRDSQALTAIMLIVLGFLVNYMRRYALDWHIAPVIIWFIGFLATVLPFTETRDVWIHIHGLLIGFAVSALIIFLFFPENYSKLYVENSNKFFTTFSDGLKRARFSVLKGSEFDEFRSVPARQVQHVLAKIVEVNQTIQQRYFFAAKDKTMSDVLRLFYSLLTAYTLMIDSLHTIEITKHHISKRSRLIISRQCRKLIKLFALLYMDDNFKIYARDLRQFEKLLCTKHVHGIEDVPELLLALLNLRLSFFLIEKRVKTLVESGYGA